MNQKDMKTLRTGDRVIEKATGWEYKVARLCPMQTLDSGSLQTVGKARQALCCEYSGTERIPYWAMVRYFAAKEISKIQK